MKIELLPAPRRPVVKLLGAVFVLFAASLANAQTVDPQSVDFSPSADHDTTLSDGTPIVSHYDLEFYIPGDPQLVEVIDLGKPAPASDGLIHAAFQPFWPAAGNTYEARVSAVGPTGIGESDLSNIFSYSGGCSYQISPTSVSIGAAGGAGSANVSTGSSCKWTPTTPDPWVTILTSSTTGNGVLDFSVAPNTTTSARVATVNAGGQSLTVNQAANSACTPTISISSVSAPAAGQTGVIAVSAPAGCSWAAKGIDWAWFESPNYGTGNGSVSYEVEPNRSSSPRSGTITVAGQPVTVIQAAVGSCAYTVAPNSVSAPAGGSTGTISVTTTTSCDWTASSPVGWATLTPASGSGSGNTTYVIAPNTTSTPRSTTLNVAGQPVTVSQAGVCAFTISSTAVSSTAAGGNGTITVTTASGCSWTASSPAAWVSVSPASSNGSGTVTYSVAVNTASTPRSTTLLVAGYSVSVSQDAASASACAFVASPTSIAAPAAGATGKVTVTTTSGCAWTASSPVAWVSVAPDSASGSGSVAYTVFANMASTARSTTLMIAGNSVTVSQPAVCAFTVSPTSASVSAAGGSGTISVMTTGGCAWTAASPVAWVTLSQASGSGGGSTAYYVAPNSGGSSRTATLTVAGTSVTVTQSGSSCVFTISPSNFVFTGAGGSGSVTVTGSKSCSWTSVGIEWAYITPNKNKAHSGTVAFQVDPNATGSDRTGTLTIAGNPVTVLEKK